MLYSRLGARQVHQVHHTTTIALINEINIQRQPFKTVIEKQLFCNNARWTYDHNPRRIHG